VHGDAASVLRREHQLQDPTNKRKILSDDKLAMLFTFPLNMFTINKQISKHCKASGNVVNGGKAEKPARKKAKTAALKAENGNNDGAAARAPSGFKLPQKLSVELAAVVGVEAASRGEVTKRLWAYIKERGLQSPDNKQVILVKNDPQLHALLGVDECKGFSMSTHLKGHFLGRADAE
jgi:upstream activation factor subunit UAF30